MSLFKFQLEKENTEKVYEAIEIARKTGKIKKGSNEVTKEVERGTAKLVAIAEDINPQEIIMHLPVLCEEKDILCVPVPSKEDLGASAGLQLSTAAVAITVEGEAKKTIEEIKNAIPETSEEKPKEEAKPEEKKEAPKEKPVKEEKPKK